MAAASSIRSAARLIAESDALLITCGAGMGVDSGLPDFRGDEGFWRAYPPLRAHGSFAALANPTWFRDDPELAWGFYGHRYHQYRRTVPHAGHAVLRRLAEGKANAAAAAAGPAAAPPTPAWVFTTNVDGQWQASGWPEGAVVEAHGSLHHVQCTARRSCYHAFLGRVQTAEEARVGRVVVDESTFRAETRSLPLCPRGCGSYARPNVLMFGDSEWVGERTAAQQARMDAWLQGMHDAHGGTRLCVVDIGSGSAIPTARLTAESTALWFARRAGGLGSLVRINPREPEISTPELREGSGRGVSLRLGALEALLWIGKELGVV